MHGEPWRGGRTCGTRREDRRECDEEGAEERGPLLLHAAPGSPFAPTLVYEWAGGTAEVYGGRVGVLHVE
jgi:hypothetical protein